MRIEMKSWKLAKDDDGNLKIVGSYSVMSGATKVATQDFNGGYGTVSVPFPAELVVEAQALDAKVAAAVSKHYGIEQ
jgi:hypothetical protein